MVVRAMHEVVPAGESVKVLGVGQRVGLYQPGLAEHVVVCDYELLPCRIWSEVRIGHSIFFLLPAICGTIVLAE